MQTFVSAGGKSNFSWFSSDCAPPSPCTKSCSNIARFLLTDYCPIAEIVRDVLVRNAMKSLPPFRRVLCSIVLFQLVVERIVERIVAMVHSRPSSGKKRPELGAVQPEIILEVLTKQQATISHYVFHELIPCLTGVCTTPLSILEKKDWHFLGGFSCFGLITSD